MTKLRMLSLHNIENVPDHIIEEMRDFSLRLALGMKLYVETVSPNIALAGVNWAHCVMIKELVSNNPEELRKAARFTCKMILENMEILINQMEKENDAIN